MKITNKEIIKNEIKKLNYDLGCFAVEIEKLTKKELKKVIDNLDQESTDVDVFIKKDLYIVEITTIDNEKDIQILNKDEYIDRYGDQRWNNEN